MTDEEEVHFNDPLAWVYCQYCAFQVAADVATGVILRHDRRVEGSAHVECKGTGTEPVAQPGPEAVPKPEEAEPLLEEEVVPDGDAVD